MEETTQQPETAAHPWGLDDREPTDLITLWPGESPPTLSGVLDALRLHVHGDIEIVAEPPLESLAKSASEAQPIWLAIIKFPETAEHWAVPCVIWAEPMRDIGADTIKQLKAESVKWALGLETLLWLPDPATHFLALVNLLGRAFPKSPAIRDVNKEGWHDREELDHLLLPDPSIIVESVLWFVHAVGVDAEPDENSRLWVYTHGLSRCGVPELELLDVPHTQRGVAMMLLNAVAELVMEEGMPDPGERFAIGNDMTVSVQPWREVAATINPDLPGHIDNRSAHGGVELIGARAVICGGEPKDGRWTWPEEAAQILAAHGEAALYKTARGLRRQTHLARASWKELAEVFSSLPRALHRRGPQRQAVFLVQAAFQKPHAKSKGNPGESREHLWLEIDRFIAPDHSRVEGTLINDANDIPHLRSGTEVKVDRTLVSDWQALTSQGIFGPSNIAGLQEAIRLMCGAAT